MRNGTDVVGTAVKWYIDDIVVQDAVTKEVMLASCSSWVCTVVGRWDFEGETGIEAI